MGSTNMVCLMGSLCRDPKLRTTPSGTTVCHLLMAVNRRSGISDYLPVIVWDADATSCQRYLRTGSLVHVEGRLASRNYEKPEGSRHVAIEVMSSKISFLDLENTEGHKNANIVVLMGNLCKEPNLRMTPSGKVLTELLVAVDKKNGGADYLPVICWNKDAEACAKHLSMGSLVHIHGILSSRNYKKPSGTKHVAIEVLAQEIEFLSRQKRQRAVSVESGKAASSTSM